MGVRFQLIYFTNPSTSLNTGCSAVHSRPNATIPVVTSSAPLTAMRACTRCINSLAANSANARLKVASLGSAKRRSNPHSRPAQTRKFHDLHHTDTFAVHAYDLLAAFMQYFSRLLAGISFLHELLTLKIFKS